MFEILVASTSIMEYELAQHRLARDPVDLVIEPDVHAIRAFEFHKAARAVQAGLAAFDESLPALERVRRRRARGTLRRVRSRATRP